MLSEGESKSIAEWLDVDSQDDLEDGESPEPPDVFVVGFQEVG